MLRSKNAGKFPSLCLCTALLFLSELSNGAEPAPLANTLGAQRTLVLMANFQENPAEQPLTAEAARQLIFGEVSDFFYENSYRQTWLAGDVAGWFTLPLSNGVCNTFAARDAANQAAASAGIDVGSYRRIVYLFTKTACNTYGSATLGGNPSLATIYGLYSTELAELIAHEMGHNFGLEHSRALDCNGVTLGPDCNSVEYGDTYDTMGNPEFGHFNAVQKARLGWLGAGASPAITTVMKDGTYTIDNLETMGSQPKALRIPAGVDPVSGKQIWFYIEYRQSLGFDSFLAKRSYGYYRGDVTHGVVVHQMVEGDPQSGTLLHMNLNTPFRDRYGRSDWFDPALAVGSAYVHPDTGMTIRSEWANGSSAGVSVSFAEPPAPPPPPPPPSDTLAPSVPSSLIASATSRQVALSWSASADNVAVKGYRILRNGAVLAETATTSYADSTGVSGVSYEYRVVAYDAAANASAPSAAVVGVRAKAGGGGGKAGGGSGKGRK